ncbi:15739_t:CDS:2, partial [Racocetra persica]
GDVSIDQIKVIFVLVGAYPAALGLRFIRIPELRHLYNIAASLFIFLGVFDLFDAVRILFVNSLVVYLIMLYIKNHWGPKLAFIFLLTHMSMSHIYRQLLAVSTAEYDATGPEMVIVIKLTSLAYCIYDGQNLNLKEVEQESDDQSLHPRQKSFTNRIIDSSIDVAQFTPRQLKKAVPANKFPSLLEYFGFIFYFPSIMVGPAIEFEDYRQWAASSGEFENMPNDLGLKQALSKLWFGFFILAMSFAFGGRYPISWTLTEDYKKLKLLDRIWFVQMACSCARFRFYIVWLMSEGSMILSGLGYNGRDGKGNPRFDRVVNIDVFAYETSDNPRALIQSWNCQTDKWLKNYVYLRLSPPGQRPTFYTTFTTFAICAIWHGYYPGYYCTFLSAACLVNCHRSKCFRSYLIS